MIRGPSPSAAYAGHIGTFQQRIMTVTVKVTVTFPTVPVPQH
jgi:hypothetical protein